jgi:hypothetical protein
MCPSFHFILRPTSYLRMPLLNPTTHSPLSNIIAYVFTDKLEGNTLLSSDSVMAQKSRSRFKLNVSAGSQNRAIRAIHEPEGRDESCVALKLKRNLDLNCKSRSLSIFCLYWDKHCPYWDNQTVWAFGRSV